MPPTDFEPFSNIVVEDADGPDTSAGPLSLLSILLALLVVAIVGGAIALSFSMGLPLAVINPETSPAPHRLGMAGSRIAVPHAGVRGPPARERSPTRPPRPGDSVAAATPAKAQTEAEFVRPHRRQGVENGTRPRGGQCGRHFYTYCAQTRTQEAYYSTASHRCVSTASDGAHVCNRGANRFTDFESCLASCVHRGRQPPRERCFESALFTACSRQDVSEEWWFFDGTGCAQWNFPLGKCPAQESWVFSKRDECEATCVRRVRDDGANSDDRRCDIPVATTCSPGQLKFPYFADMQAEGSARCVKALSGTLSARRCLIGSNRFDSLSTCSQVCDSESHAERQEGRTDK